MSDHNKEIAKLISEYNGPLRIGQLLHNIIGSRFIYKNAFSSTEVFDQVVGYDLFNISDERLLNELRKWIEEKQNA